MASLSDLNALEQSIGYSFSDRELLTLALSHRSYGAINNERLEFLGDAALGFVVADWLYEKYPGAKESELTLMRASLVRRRTLAAVARHINLGSHLRLGAGERSSGGHRRESILADALEALLGAAFKDGGLPAVNTVIARLFADRLGTVDPTGRKDPKTQVQEWLQGRGYDLPRYEVVEQSGDAHAPSFRVACVVGALSLRIEAVAGSRRDAEKAAAREVLAQIEAGGLA
jgi:ribonuclease-3